MKRNNVDSDRPLLQVIDVHVAREGKEILRGVNMTVEEGQVHAILGLNGSGKSTLAYTLMGSSGYTPSDGKIIFQGEEIQTLNISERGKRGITLAWQEPARFEGLTVERYLKLGMRESDPARMREALEAVGLDPERYLSRLVDESLSGGERKRVELAAVYAMQPRFAILDEPDSGIDVLTMEDIADLIEQMSQEGTAVLLISHQEDVVNISDMASLICEGEVVSTDVPEVVCDRYERWCRPCDQAEPVEAEGDYERF